MSDAEKQNITTETKKEKAVLRFIKKHRILSAIVVGTFVLSFFLPGRSVYVEYSSNVTHDYVRIDYSVYGYCVDVVQCAEQSVQTAKDLKRQILFMNMDESVLHIAEKWTGYYGNNGTFKLKVKGYVFNTIERRDEMINMINEKTPYKADAIVL